MGPRSIMTQSNKLKNFVNHWYGCKWLRTVERETYKQTKQDGLQLQDWKQRKPGGSGNLIRGGAGVLNLSKVTRSLYRPAPKVIEHWCFQWAAAAALNCKTFSGNWGCTPCLFCWAWTQNPRDWKMEREQDKARKEHACGMASGHKGRNLRHRCDVHAQIQPRDKVWRMQLCTSTETCLHAHGLSWQICTAAKLSLTNLQLLQRANTGRW